MRQASNDHIKDINRKNITQHLIQLMMSSLLTLLSMNASADNTCDEAQSDLVFYCQDKAAGEIKVCLYEGDDYNITYETSDGKVIHDVSKFKNDAHFIPAKNGKLNMSLILTENKNIYKVEYGFAGGIREYGRLITIVNGDYNKYNCHTPDSTKLSIFEKLEEFAP